MSIKVMSAVWDYSRASGTPLLVLLKLADWANDDGECWPSISTIAQKCRLKDERHVKRIIHDTLERELGEVIVIPGGGKSSSKGGLRSNRYRIVVHMPEDDAAMVVEGPPQIVVEGPPEPSVEPSVEPPLNPQPKAGDQKPHRRGMRGTGTSPRELRAGEQQAVADLENEAEADRLVLAIPEKYAHCPEEYIVAKIDRAFYNDPVRRQASLDHLQRLTAVS